MKHISLEERFQGLLLGGAIGDALGMPTENISRSELNKNYNGKIIDFEKPLADHPCSHLDAGQYTDDTQQLILLTESLVEKKAFDLEDFGRKIGEWANKCLIIPSYDRFSGETSIRAGISLYEGNDPTKTGISSVTCGAAMRIPPLGIFYHNKIDELPEAAKLAATVTHNHPVAIDSALFISHIVAYLTNGLSVEESIEKARGLLTSDLIRNIDFAINNRDKNPDEVAGKIGASQSCYETVPMALHCFIHSSANYIETVINAANLVPGDTDSIACIAGAISGAYNGVKAIPLEFQKKVEGSNYLKNLALRLLNAS